MTAILLFLKNIPWWVWLALVCIGALVLAYHKGVSVTDARWQARWSAREAQYAQAAEDAIHQHQLETVQTEHHNQEILDAYNKATSDRDAAAADADLAHRLLRAARSCPSGGAVPQAPSVSGAPGPTPKPGSDSDLASAVTGVLRACELDAEQLTALQQQIQRQL